MGHLTFVSTKQKVMKRRNIKLFSIAAIAIIFLQGCMADLRTSLVKKEGLTDQHVAKGKELLEKAWKKQGFDKLDGRQVYSYNGQDTWQGAMGRMGKIWPELKADLHFKYKIGTFDGQANFENGARKGDFVGLQNWNYYEGSTEGDIEFQPQDKRITFGLAAFQYFGEMIGRLKEAPIISYAGKGTMKGKSYDLVFCTWNTPKPHQNADQYIAWINEETGLMEYTQYTIRENYLKMPGGRMFFGGVEFGDFRNIDGVLIPHEHTVYALKLKEKKSKNLHQLLISDFEFDNFDPEDLRPNKNIEQGGDFK